MARRPPEAAISRPGHRGGRAGRDVALLLEPRFPGGTSAAVASEMEAIRDMARLRVFGLRSRMFGDRPPAPVLERTMARLGLSLEMNPAHVSAETVVLHNPAFLKFDEGLPLTVTARRLMVVTHENFLRPGGREGFDVAGCLARIDRATLASEKLLCPVSPRNRETVRAWLDKAPRAVARTWRLLGEDWFNICDFAMIPPTATPADRRGRLSRPGIEKFPAPAVMERCFPPHAEANVILGADRLMDQAAAHPHWTLLPFRAIEVEAFFRQIDFMVHFVSAGWSESFGRVLAEAIAAGKVVISDAETARGFGGGVVAARPDQVDGLIAGFLADPARYRAQVEKAQRQLQRFSPDAFRAFFSRVVPVSGDRVSEVAA